MTHDLPALGLLLDVDGPIADPLTRSIVIPSITRDLVALADSGIPIAFNTGRSDGFLANEVVGPLVDGGLSADARVFGVCEKGAVWFRITPDGVGELSIDESLVPTPEFSAAVEQMVADRFSEWMFFDATKRASLAVEQRTDVASEVFLAERDDFCRGVIEICRTFDLGVTWNGETTPAADGTVTIRIDPTIISTDIESVVVGKDFGAERAIALIEASGPVPRRWRTVGDSRTDYAMADWLHANGFDTAHVDVRPADGRLDKPYPVLVADDPATTNDAAGAEFLRRWAVELLG
ncbi:hypothetical protein [Herbiconiux liangxiaofengii]|uniref:hypothetical protein n=1 Tax=Herbiconiux liangxiaofengii TaxID=3342795 RepID=UPI0035BB8D85